MSDIDSLPCSHGWQAELERMNREGEAMTCKCLERAAKVCDDAATAYRREKFATDGSPMDDVYIAYCEEMAFTSEVNASAIRAIKCDCVCVPRETLERWAKATKSRHLSPISPKDHDLMLNEMYDLLTPNPNGEQK